MNTSIRDHVRALPDDELHELLRRDYLRRLIRYKRADSDFRKKYDMDYDEFVATSIVARNGFSWEVESDSQDWEMAIDGIRTMERKLRQLDGEDS